MSGRSAAGPVTSGLAIRVHGDYHLRRVLRTDAGWIVAGFGDDPLIGRSGGSGETRGALRVAARGPCRSVVFVSSGRRGGRGSPAAVGMGLGRSLGRVLGAAQPGGARRRLPRRRGHRPARGAGPLASRSPRLEALVRRSCRELTCAGVAGADRQQAAVMLPSADSGSTRSSASRRSSAAFSGPTTLIMTPVPSSKPARVVRFGRMWTCQWYMPVAR